VSRHPECYFPLPQVPHGQCLVKTFYSWSTFLCRLPPLNKLVFEICLQLFFCSDHVSSFLPLTVGSSGSHRLTCPISSATVLMFLFPVSPCPRTSTHATTHSTFTTVRRWHAFGSLFFFLPQPPCPSVRRNFFDFGAVVFSK